jgi:hypothetical protein
MKRKIIHLLETESKELSKKYFLVPLCRDLEVLPKSSWNKENMKRHLFRAIKPSQYCENSSDPVSLTPIDSIKDIVVWKQNNKYYGASAESLFNLFERNLFINPYAIDYSTGIEDSQDRLSYLEKHDMRNTDVVKKIYSMSERLNMSTIDETSMSKDDYMIYKMNSTIENICESQETGQSVYVDEIFRFLQHAHVVESFEILSSSLQNVSVQIVSLMETQSDARCCNLLNQIILHLFRSQHIYSGLEMFNFTLASISKNLDHNVSNSVIRNIITEFNLNIEI